MNSIACSRLRTLGGVSFRASSAEEERVLVRCFVLQTFSSMSSALPFCPMTIPLYTFSPGPTKSVPRSCAENRPYATASPDSKAIRDPCLRYWKSPLYGAYPSKVVFRIPVPLVEVRNSPRKPIRPRDGIWNSRRTDPSLAVLIP